MPVTLRAAPRKASWRSSARAAEASCSTSSTAPGSSGSGEPCTVMPRLFSRGLSTDRSWSETRGVALADLLDQQEQRVVLGNQVAQPQLRQAGGGDAEELLGRMVDEAEAVLGIEQHHRHRQGAQDLRHVRRPAAFAQRQRGAGDRIDHAASASISSRRGGGTGDATGDQPVVEACRSAGGPRRHPAAGSPPRGTRPNRAGRASTRTRACAPDARPAWSPKWSRIDR